MKKLCVLIFSLFSFLLCYSQYNKSNKYNKSNSIIISYKGNYGLLDDNYKWIIKPFYDQLGESGYDYFIEKYNIFDSKGFLIASKNSKYGFINENEEIKIPFLYSDLYGFDINDNAIASIKEEVSNKEKYGIINRVGDWIVQPLYDNIIGYSDNQIYDNQGCLLVKNNHKYGFVDKNNIIKIPIIFDNLSSFDNDGFAVAYEYQRKYEISDSTSFTSNKDNKCGIIDRNGNWVIPPKYYNIMRFSGSNIFDSKGYLKVTMGSDRNYIMGYLDSNRNFITGNANPALLNNYENDMAVLVTCDTIANINLSKCNYGVIDRKGNWIIPPIYTSIDWSGVDFKDDFFDSKGYLLVEKNKKRGFINIKNKIKIPLVFDDLTSFDVHNQSIASLKDSVYDAELKVYKQIVKTGIINRKGKWILSPIYECVLSYRDSLGINNSYSDPKGFIMVKNNNKWGFLDKEFKVKVPLIFDTLEEFDDKDFACACIKIDDTYYGKKCGFINRNGEWEIEPKFNLLRPFNAIGLALARLNNREGYINRQGKFFFDPDKISD